MYITRSSKLVIFAKYHYTDRIKEKGMSEACIYKILIEKHGERRALGMHICESEDNIKYDLRRM
jgi:hypothetical protein